jgi:hypothetical protein
MNSERVIAEFWEVRQNLAVETPLVYIFPLLQHLGTLVWDNPLHSPLIKETKEDKYRWVAVIGQEVT